MQPFFPNYLLLFSFKHIIDIEREKNYDTRKGVRRNWRISKKD